VEQSRPRLGFISKFGEISSYGDPAPRTDRTPGRQAFVHFFEFDRDDDPVMRTNANVEPQQSAFDGEINVLTVDLYAIDSSGLTFHFLYRNPTRSRVRVFENNLIAEHPNPVRTGPNIERVSDRVAKWTPSQGNFERIQLVDELKYVAATISKI
jgi:hypothetical protein